MFIAKQNIEKNVYEIVAKVFKKDVGELTSSTRFKEDLGAKSVHGMKLCALINYQFKTKLSMAELLECADIAETVEMLDKMLNV
jgi:acyl carrier protein